MLASAGCDSRPDTGPVVVSAIGGALPPSPRLSRDQPARLLTDSVAQGLVRFDAGGQIEPGLAERWIVIDGGLRYIFRLRDAAWSDGQLVTAGQVAAILRRQIHPDSTNPLAPFLTAIDEIVAMTPQVIEIRLERPRPDLLKLFAQPDLALLRTRPLAGTGPYRLVAESPGLLRPAPDLDRIDPDDAPPGPERDVRLIGERAARAIARFARHESDLVTGGTFTNWPLIATADVAPATVRVDPATGLFGLAIVDRGGFLSEASNRAAVSQAIDRAALTNSIAPAWEATDRILPDSLDSAAPPQVPAWTILSLSERLAGARARVAAWGQAVALRVALPAGPGGTLVYAHIAAGLLSIGITPRRVGPDAPAELRLVDEVAPYDSARWYLATACAPCGEGAQAALVAARDAPTLAERAQRIAEADAALNEDAAFIPLARPLRWSLVSPRLRQWQPNPRAWHPLNHLRDEPR